MILEQHLSNVLFGGVGVGGGIYNAYKATWKLFTMFSMEIWQLETNSLEWNLLTFFFFNQF